MTNNFRLPETGFVRLRQLIGPNGPVPVSRATIYSWMQDGHFPRSVPLGPGRVRGFRVEDVRAFLAKPMPQSPRDARDPAPGAPESA